MPTNTKSLKIGLVIDDGLDKPDGVQQYVLAIGQWLQQNGHIVHYLAGQTARTDLENVHSLSRNVKVNSNGNHLSIPLLARRAQLREVLNRERFDILHVQTPYSPLMGEQLIQLAGPQTAVVGTFHILPNSQFISFGTRLLGLWCHRSLKRFDTMLSVSPAAAEFAQKTFKVDSVVLPNVIDYKRFHTAKPFKQYDDDTLNILFLGRLVQRKGCLTLLKAVAELAQDTSLPTFRVIICGKGPLETSLKAFAEQAGIAEYIVFTGFVEEADKPRYYASADIAVFPSSGGESFGIVLLEAMASGQAAVLAGDNPGYRSVMEPQPDTLFAAKDHLALANKLRQLLQSKKKRQALSAWGEGYTKAFDIERVGHKLVEIYTEALRKHKNL